jgi:uncharacterized ferritin-like protein (DUF455 family)
VLVALVDVPQRSAFTPGFGHAAACAAHIEFNAIDLALTPRPDMLADYYTDWL